MALLLNIDTATEVASVCISRGVDILAYAENQQQREHAAFVHTAVDGLTGEAGVPLSAIDAFAVTAGPGSYTGLRVGMATAKGFCYAFNKPLIAVTTLEVMAQAALESLEVGENDWLCPMIDARRMEVFTALYDCQLKVIVEPQPLILDEKTFEDYISKRRILFFGSGSAKFAELISHNNACFKEVVHSVKNLATLAERDFQQRKFSDISYSEPNYFKDFQLMSKR